jgi:3-dehydroquinate synthase
MSASFEIVFRRAAPVPPPSAASLYIRSSMGCYPVKVASDSFAASLPGRGASAIIADEFFRPALQRSRTPVIFVAATEASKSLDAAPEIIEKIRIAGANRQTNLVAIGGGVVQDLSAFIASVYMRGLTWSYMPTTVLAMVDSCIGGKSSINVGPYKNLIGTFHPPESVLIDPALARTLPAEERAGGLIEAAKICFCRGEQSFARHLSFGPSIDMSTEGLQQVILNSLEAKQWFIENDEFDRRERLLLNFGHTFGHAIEGASGFAIPHGIAVGLGILCAIEFERQRDVCYFAIPQVAMLERHIHKLLNAVPDSRLAWPLAAISGRDIMERFYSDKKHGAAHFTLILIAQSGRVALRKMERSSQVTRDLANAIATVVARYA